ncbi:MAG TPA: hypothetical protein VN784_17685 [Candidatus Limnocylindrales bacterium]|nr:hypothetical protein [Candidatus Limnocylindrales bacterium]
MNEAETSAEHIDPALKAAGWGVVEGSRIRREYPIAPGRIEGHGKRGKPLTADSSVCFCKNLCVLFFAVKSPWPSAFIPAGRTCKPYDP